MNLASNERTIKTSTNIKKKNIILDKDRKYKIYNKSIFINIEKFKKFEENLLNLLVLNMPSILLWYCNVGCSFICMQSK